MGRLVADAAVTLALVIAHGTVLLGQVANPLPRPKAHTLGRQCVPVSMVVLGLVLVP